MSFIDNIEEEDDDDDEDDEDDEEEDCDEEEDDEDDDKGDVEEGDDGNDEERGFNEYKSRAWCNGVLPNISFLLILIDIIKSEWELPYNNISHIDSWFGCCTSTSELFDV